MLKSGPPARVRRALAWCVAALSSFHDMGAALRTGGLGVSTSSAGTKATVSRGADHAVTGTTAERTRSRSPGASTGINAERTPARRWRSSGHVGNDPKTGDATILDAMRPSSRAVGSAVGSKRSHVEDRRFGGSTLTADGDPLGRGTSGGESFLTTRDGGGARRFLPDPEIAGVVAADTDEGASAGKDQPHGGREVSSLVHAHSSSVSAQAPSSSSQLQLWPRWSRPEKTAGTAHLPPTKKTRTDSVKGDLPASALVFLGGKTGLPPPPLPGAREGKEVPIPPKHQHRPNPLSAAKPSLHPGAHLPVTSVAHVAAIRAPSSGGQPAPLAGPKAGVVAHLAGPKAGSVLSLPSGLAAGKSDLPQSSTLEIKQKVKGVNIDLDTPRLPTVEDVRSELAAAETLRTNRKVSECNGNAEQENFSEESRVDVRGGFKKYDLRPRIFPLTNS